jgi:hypothetical protein
MDHADWERAAAVYLPLGAAIIARLLYGRQPRQFAACLLSVLWTIPSLLVLQRLNEYAGWWSFAAGSEVQFRGMPLELFLGWILLWGLVPQLALPRFGIARSAVVMIAVDCVLMPMCSSALYLKTHWLVGETAAVAVVLIPALCIGHWTRENTHLRQRAALQIVTSGLLFLFLVPEIIFALRPGTGWAPLFSLSNWARQIDLAARGTWYCCSYEVCGARTRNAHPIRPAATAGHERHLPILCQPNAAVLRVGYGGMGWFYQEWLDVGGRVCVGRLQCRDRRLGRGRRSGPSFRERMAGLPICSQKLVAKVEAVP